MNDGIEVFCDYDARRKWQGVETKSIQMWRLQISIHRGEEEKNLFRVGKVTLERGFDYSTGGEPCRIVVRVILSYEICKKKISN